QPEADMFAGFADFAFYRMALKAVHLVAGFGRIVDLAPKQVLTETGDAAELVAAEPQIIAHMNGDHDDAVRLYATNVQCARASTRSSRCTCSTSCRRTAGASCRCCCGTAAA